ncbi:YdeI/OmpD-associated family protein [Catellatospora sp. NPDC049111]|uniref:YdeI/OmpD-associated family protein n=1 Tax=Catellatospora sp. NPDC049111 TaxID=3155271 RepID=UPI0033D5C4B9
MADELELMSFVSGQEFEQWLEREHAASPGILIKFAKKGSGVVSLTYVEAVEVSLCFGWIDGQAKRIDDVFYQQRYTPRRARSIWSKINTAKAAALIESGRMRPAGQAQIDAAKADGRWEAAYHGPATAQIPAEIAADPQALRVIEAMNRTNRYAYISRFHQAKRPETRARLLDRLHQGHLFHP